ncbi:MAG: hypothetical protein QM594_21040 [Niabella sp.]
MITILNPNEMKRCFFLLFIFSVLFYISCKKGTASTEAIEIMECDPPYQHSERVITPCLWDSCDIYIRAWKEAFLQANNMTEDFFNKHVFLHWARKVEPDKFRVVYDVEINEAYGTASDIFYIMQNGQYRSGNETKKLLLEEPGAISKVINRDDFHFKTFESARKAAMEQLNLNNLCIEGSTLTESGNFILHLNGKLALKPDKCIDVSVDVVNGVIKSSWVSCYPQTLKLSKTKVNL